jgi:hypothetical protein
MIPSQRCFWPRSDSVECLLLLCPDFKGLKTDDEQTLINLASLFHSWILINDTHCLYHVAVSICMVLNYFELNSRIYTCRLGLMS